MLKRFAEFSRKIPALWLLLLVAILLPARLAWGQTSLGELGATQSINSEMEGRRTGNVQGQTGDAVQGQSNNAAANPSESSAPAAAPAPDFASKANTLTFSVKMLFQLLFLVVVFWIWVAAGDWVNRDTQINELGWHKWSLIYYLPFVLVGFILFFIPAPLWVRGLVMFVVFVFTWVPYVLVHNKNVEPHETVLTGSWWRFAVASTLTSVGIKVSTERKAEYEKGAPVELIAMGAADPSSNNANLLTARHSPGYLLLKDLFASMVSRRSDRVMLDFTKQAVNVKHEIDGVWHNAEPRDRESSDVMLAVIKTLANLDVKDRRNKQKGQFGAKYEGKSYLCHVVTQGVQTGERVVINRVGEKDNFVHYSQLGMREGLQTQWAEIMAADQGLVIFSSLPGGGLTTITNVSLEETDRLMRDFVAIEDIHHREHDIQNVSVETYDSAKGETPSTYLPQIIRKYPNVYVVRDLTDLEAAKQLFQEIKDNHLVITSIRAKDACEALLRFLQLKVPAKEFAQTAKAVLYQRMIRKLCSDCKVGYTPPADVLRKLGIPAGKVDMLYRPPKGEEIDKPCKTCQGLGYYGRTGLFELLVVTDKMREILAKQPKLELLKAAAREDRQRSLQEEGVLLVAQGTTSLQELQRVLQQ